jgi:hypothetical protein
MDADDLKRAVGELTAESAYADFCLARTIALARGERVDVVEDVLPLVRDVRSALKKLSQDISEAHKHQCALSREFLRFKQDILDAYDARDRFVHSMEVLQLSSSEWDPLTGEHWHPKSGHKIQVTASEVQRLSNRLRGLGGTAMRMTVAIEQWPTRHDDFWI